MSDETEAVRTARFLASLEMVRADTRAWRAAAPDGLTVLCAVESLVTGDPRSRVALDRACVAVRAMPHGMVERDLLDHVMAATASCDRDSFTAVARPLFAYARHLQGDGRWRLAADVYCLIITGTTDHLLAARAALYLGACLRLLGQFTAAADAYTYAGQAAEKANSDYLRLKSRLGLIKVTVCRGDLGDGAAALRALIDLCRDDALSSVRAEALHELGRIDFRRGAIEDAIDAYRQSWVLTQSREERDRILSDLTASLSDCGFLNEARELGEILRTTSLDPEVRWAATINLMEFARMARREPECVRYRRLLEGEYAVLPPHLKADYEYFAGQGFETFGDARRAAERYRRAILVAAEHGLAEARHRSEVALAALESGHSTVLAGVAIATTPPATIQQLTADVRAGREVVAVE